MTIAWLKSQRIDWIHQMFSMVGPLPLSAREAAHACLLGTMEYTNDLSISKHQNYNIFQNIRHSDNFDKSLHLQTATAFYSIKI